MTSPHTAAAAALATMAAPGTVAAATTMAAAVLLLLAAHGVHPVIPPTLPTLPTPSEASVYVCCRLLRLRGAIASRRAGHSPAGPRMAVPARPCQPSELCGGVTAAAPSPRALQPCWTAECTARANAGRRTRCCGRAPFDNGRGTFVSPPLQRDNLRRGFQRLWKGKT